MWVSQGTRPRAARDRRRTSACLFGAACPERGAGAAVVLPLVNVEAMTARLAGISRHVTEGAHAALALDQAGWRTSPKLQVVSLPPLPPHAPDLNPVEQAWAYLRANVFSHRVWSRYDAIVGACCDARNTLMSTPERLASSARRTWDADRFAGAGYVAGLLLRPKWRASFLARAAQLSSSPDGSLMDARDRIFYCMMPPKC